MDATRSPGHDALMPHPSGTLMCLASGAAFGAMGVFVTLDYCQRAKVGTLLAVRFSLAAVLFWALVLGASGGVRELRAVGRRRIGAGLGVGATGHAAHAVYCFA